jgi:hypothetical protein
MPKNASKNIDRNLLFVFFCLALLVGYPLFSVVQNFASIWHIPIKIIYVFVVWAAAIFAAFSIINKKNE